MMAGAACDPAADDHESRLSLSFIAAGVLTRPLCLNQTPLGESLRGGKKNAHAKTVAAWQGREAACRGRGGQHRPWHLCFHRLTLAAGKWEAAALLPEENDNPAVFSMAGNLGEQKPFYWIFFSFFVWWCECCESLRRSGSFGSIASLFLTLVRLGSRFVGPRLRWRTNWWKLCVHFLFFF